MKQNDLLVALFGRPVWFRCERCNRVKVADAEGISYLSWQDEQLGMVTHNVSPQDVWWFNTVCDFCESRLSN